MSMFDVLSNVKVIGAGAAGTAIGGTTVHLYHTLTTGRANAKLEKRLGEVDPKVQERAIKKVAILKALAFRDGEFCLNEKVFLYRYIANSLELQADIKVELAKELEDAPPTALGEIWKFIKDSLSFSDLFTSEEDAAGFVHSMKQLARADGELCKSEDKHILKVCCNCKIPKHIYR